MQRKKKKDVRKHKIIGIWFVLMVLFISELLLYTWCRVQCIRDGYAISKATERHRQLVALQSKLRVELAHLKSPERIAQIAKGRFGLTAPTPEQIIIIP
jgi:cell division protein FtsL